MASASFALPRVPRCERPSAEVSSLPGLQPGGLAHGPDEKLGRCGFVRGLAGRTSAPAAVASVNVALLAESTRRVGTAWPVDGCKDRRASRKGPRKIRGTTPKRSMLH